MEQALYTVEEAARFLKLHPKTLRRKIRAGEIESTKLGKRYRFTLAQLEAYCGSKIDLNPGKSSASTRRVVMSAVVDITAISPPDSQRIANYLMASMNNARVLGSGESAKTAIQCQYLEEAGELKVLISGAVDRVVMCANLIDSLLDGFESINQESAS